VIVPRNGYVNRLQALVSAQILARDIEAELELAWLPQPAAPSTVDLVLDAAAFPGRLAGSDFSLPGDLELDDVPVGITRIGESSLLVAGGLAGEQVLMSELRRELAGPAKTLVIVAGGKFWLHGDAELSSADANEFRWERHRAYQRLRLNALIEEQAQKTIAQLPENFIGLHLRFGDRNWQAPSQRRLRGTMHHLREHACRDVFVAGDDAQQIREWSTWLENHDWHVWTNSNDASSALSPRTPDALVDWRVLGAASRVVYFSESSFGEEAAVASGHYETSVPLEPSRIRALRLKSLWHARNALTYPSRHWLSRQESPSDA
jgi:hypothetical protein